MKPLDAARLLQTRRAPFVDLAGRVAECERCPRLRAHCREIARVKRRAYRDEEYWGRPVPGFGDPDARLLIIGLAPAAHGANRTGRMFTGDSSGSWLYEALHRYGWANQPDTTGAGDGLRLSGAYVTASARCAPPANKPTPAEIANCRGFLLEELSMLVRVQVVLSFGRIAFDAYLAALAARGTPWAGAKPAFAHNALHTPSATRAAAASTARATSMRAARSTEPPLLVTSYHPSRQNTQTGRLTREMFHAVFARCRAILGSEGTRGGGGRR
ncbi:MAG: uracil-DNA glycosylase [bacterium]